MEESAGPGRPYYIYFVTTPEVPQGFPMIIRQQENQVLVDWPSFAEFHDHHFADFADNTNAVAGDFRVVLRRAEYWGPDKKSFTDLEDYLCFRVELPYSETDYHAFVKKSSPLAERLKKLVNWGLPPLAGILRFEHYKFSHGKTHLFITDFFTKDWYRPPVEETPKLLSSPQRIEN